MSTPLVATLLYHEVCNHTAQSGFVRASALPYKHTPRAFAGHLDVIAQTGAPPESVSGIEPASPGRRLLLMTFDDGGKSGVSIPPVERVRRLVMGRSWAGERALRRARVFLSHAPAPVYRRYVRIRAVEEKHAA